MENDLDMNTACEMSARSTIWRSSENRNIEGQTPISVLLNPNHFAKSIIRIIRRLIIAPQAKES